MSILDRALNIGESKKFKQYEKRVALIGAFEAELELETQEELRERMDALRERAAEGESLDELLPECFAIVRETGKRTMGMRHFDVQLIGAMTLHDGCIAEMKTGEGKTLTATLAVVLNSLAVREAGSASSASGNEPDAAFGENGSGSDSSGNDPGTASNGSNPGSASSENGSAPASRERKGVHVVTVNDYLARRDAAWMSPLYTALGVSVGVLQNQQPYDEKQLAYACDVVYGTNSEFGFDYLRDNMAKSLEEKVQRGHPFAVVDEVDNILIDEARTPLIISGAPEQAADLYVKFARLAPRLKAGQTPEGMDPRSKKGFVADFDYEFDEKQKTVAITEQGVAKAERFLDIDHLYKAENGHLVNHLIQSLRAESLYKRDVDYAVIEGEVKIIDEFTGRILDGRRWSEGLHQAVEAKEGVRVQEENQTLATITYQNYFRLYDKLSGMTGTALTEATEFMKIYELPVVQVPTNMPMVRDDRNDQVYKTKEGKWEAVVKEIAARHENGQPVLVGTISVEVSELLGERLKKRGIAHTVLNAKPEHAAREAEIVAEAGQPGAVTIATNMAGRGVDIKLGGNPEHLARLELAKRDVTLEDPAYEQRMKELLPEIEAKVEANRERVTAAGGLFICGTERHESRRIDNQLRGRSGRQGDPGESRFFLSAEDDLVRLFAGDRIYKILDRLGGLDEEGNEEPIEAGMLSKQIEKAQKKVEEQNFLIRKRVLEYDDVMNEQRRIVYAYRNGVLEGKAMGEEAREQVQGAIERTIDQYTPGDYMEDWDLDGLFTALGQFFPVELGEDELDPETVDTGYLNERVSEMALEHYNAREQELGEELMGALERFLILQIIDERWREHLYDMDYLREGIHLRGFAQIDPLVAYKNEAFELFGDLMNSVWADFTRMIFNVQVTVDGQNGGGQGGAGGIPSPAFAASGNSTRAGRVSYSGGSSAMGAGAVAAAAAAAGVDGAAYNGEGEPVEALPVVEQRVTDSEHELGRNDPCWCGSGKKFKRCHGA
ncbi:MAG TPA: preprotein translocase subunit SecA [Solirubrobacteraceae bacterium]|nr:preprotein translocase subunit SecA [Solirubrobacteraceae bacterium]